MQRRLCKWLVCPLCKSGLDLAIRASDSPHGELGGEEITTGALSCAACRVYYPVYNGIPRLLTYPIELTTIFAKEFKDWLAGSLEGYHLPGSAPPLGERGVLRNFSTEWQGYKWQGKSYWNTTPEYMLEWKCFELGTSRHPLKGKLLLEVGIGIGGTADALSTTEDCEIVGMDLGYSVDQARSYFGKNPRLHIVQASVFKPPFPEGTFDVVYSHGVIHHTYSTRTAFSNIAKLSKPDASMLYIWIYSNEQERANILRRCLMGIESLLRPVISRLPSFLQTLCLLPWVPCYILFQNVYRRANMGREVATSYGLNEALHAARDRFTPPYAHRHSYEEVGVWFKEEGFGNLEFLRDEIPPAGTAEAICLNVGIRGFRTHED